MSPHVFAAPILKFNEYLRSNMIAGKVASLGYKQEMRSFLAIDFETANSEATSACSIGLVRVEEGKILHESYHLICPPSSHFQFTYIHGLSWEDVKDAPNFKSLWPHIEGLFHGVEAIIAHNVSFDRRVLEATCQYYQIPKPQLKYDCTVSLARKAFQIFPTKLPNVCEVLKIPLKHHDAMSDARACAQIALKAFSELNSRAALSDSKNSSSHLK